LREENQREKLDYKSITEIEKQVLAAFQVRRLITSRNWIFERGSSGSQLHGSQNVCKALRQGVVQSEA
jgi:hypothetical protein